MSRLAPTAFVASLLVLALPAGTTEELGGRLSQAIGDKVFQPAIGDPDPGLPRRISGQLTANELKRAIYHGTRAQRLIALEAAAWVPDPWSMLPVLATLIGTPQRQVASQAAEGLLGCLSTALESNAEIGDVIRPQAEALARQLVERAGDQRLDIDLRVASLSGLQMIQARGFARDRDALDALIDDPEENVRRAVLALLDVPLAEEDLGQLVEIVKDDPDPLVRGQVTALLCENALAHGVDAPSKDLAALLGELLGDGNMPADGIAPILGCLVRFPVAARVDLIDLALKHPDSAVAGYWEAVQSQAR